jgi:hypothetical protein
MLASATAAVTWLPRKCAAVTLAFLVGMSCWAVLQWRVRYFYHRLAATVLGAWVTASLVAGVAAFVQLDVNTLGCLVSTASPAMHVAFAVAFTVSVIAAVITDRAHHDHHDCES